MKSIKIVINDAGVNVGTLVDINNALDEVNGKASSFTITSAVKVVEIIKRAEVYLEKHNVPFTDRCGATVTYRPAGPSANAYKNSAISTEITLRRAKNGTPIWYLDKIERVAVYPRNAERFHVRISDAAARNLVKRALAAFGRTEVPAEKDWREPAKAA
jgi:hypothetical protein